MCGEHALAFASLYLTGEDPNFYDPTLPVEPKNRGLFTDLGMAAYSSASPNGYPGVEMVGANSCAEMERQLRKLQQRKENKGAVFIVTTQSEQHHNAMFYDNSDGTWKRYCQIHEYMTLTDQNGNLLPRVRNLYESGCQIAVIKNPFDLLVLIELQKIQKHLGDTRGEQVLAMLQRWIEENYSIYTSGINN